MYKLKTYDLLNRPIKSIKLTEYLPGLFYLANLIRMLSIISLPYYVITLVAGAVGILYILRQRRYDLKSILIFIGIYILSLILNWLSIRNFGISTVGSDLLLIGITLIMLLKPWSFKYGAIVFYVSAILILYSMSISTSRRILISSANYISIVMLLSCAFYYIPLGINKKKIRLIDLLPAILCFYISIWAEGRGGILACTFLLVLLLFLYMKNLTNKNAKRTTIVVTALLILGVFLYFRNYSLIDAFLGLGKWERRGIDNSARMKIWGNYFLKVEESLTYFLFGAPLDKIPIIASFNGNTHNSFLQLHAYCGIFMFTIMLVLICKSFIYYLKNKQHVIAIMMATIILRGLSDKFIFGQYGMPIMFFFVLYPFIDKQGFKQQSTDATITQWDENG